MIRGISIRCFGRSAHLAVSRQCTSEHCDVTANELAVFYGDYVLGVLAQIPATRRAGGRCQQLQSSPRGIISQQEPRCSPVLPSCRRRSSSSSVTDTVSYGSSTSDQQLGASACVCVCDAPDAAGDVIEYVTSFGQKRALSAGVASTCTYVLCHHRRKFRQQIADGLRTRNCASQCMCGRCFAKTRQICVDS